MKARSSPVRLLVALACLALLAGCAAPASPTPASATPDFSEPPLGGGHDTGDCHNGYHGPHAGSHTERRSGGSCLEGPTLHRIGPSGSGTSPLA